MLALSRDHAENPLEFYIVQEIEAHNLCNFGAISSKQLKLRAISVSEPRFYVGELRHVFKSLCKFRGCHHNFLRSLGCP